MDSFEPSKLLIAGDVHGNERWFGSLCKLARRHGCDAILQLGDFGYWPHTTAGRRFLERGYLDRAERPVGGDAE